jgi:polyhydroxyalkanoate synthesis regulator phasin
MITKERLENTIRGVISEFKRTKRITDPAAEELAAALEERVEELFDQEAIFSYREVDDSAGYVKQLRDQAQLESAETFLQEIVAWQQIRSS